MKKYYLILTAFLFISASGFSQNEKMKSSFIYNFTKYISWPQSYSQGDFKIGVLGSQAMSKELKAIAQKRKVGARKIVILDFSSYTNISKCNILYIHKSKISQIDKAILKLSLEPVLIVTDNPGSIQKGAGINFVVVGGKQKFEIRKSNIEKNGMKINSTLMKLGIQK